MDALTFLERLDRAAPQPLYVLFGDEPFLKRQVNLALRRLVLGPEDDGLGVSSHPGDKATWATVIDDLQTLPFLSPRRLVLVEQADPFVTANRARLEKLVGELLARDEGEGEAPAEPGGRREKARQEPRPPTARADIKSVLVLDVQTWAGTTRLAKMTTDSMVITCKTPPPYQVPQWCVNWCASHHRKQLSSPAAKLLVDLIGPEMGLLDMEMEKLAVYIGSAPRIDAKDVDQLVGRSRAEKTWEIFKMIGAGRVGDALGFLDQLLEQGDEPIRILGAFSMQLRRLANVARLNAQGVPLQEAMNRAGVRTDIPAARQDAEQMMRHLGRRRLDRLYDWLLETDQGLKGGSALPMRTQLERLVVRLARTRT